QPGHSWVCSGRFLMDSVSTLMYPIVHPVAGRAVDAPRTRAGTPGSVGWDPPLRDRRSSPVCGIVGIVSDSSVNQQVYDALALLQHRGQDSTGIATAEARSIHVKKAKGQVREAFRTRDMRALLGTIGLGHVRYATRGEAANE